MQAGRRKWSVLENFRSFDSDRTVGYIALGPVIQSNKGGRNVRLVIDLLVCGIRMCGFLLFWHTGWYLIFLKLDFRNSPNCVYWQEGVVYQFVLKHVRINFVLIYLKLWFPEIEGKWVSLLLFVTTSCTECQVHASHAKCVVIITQTTWFSCTLYLFFLIVQLHSC